MRVSNINGTSANACKCGSWLDHWKNYSGQTLSAYCSEKICRKNPEVGAHVQKESYSDSGWYIVPLCQDHNRATATLELVDGVTLVSANVSNTCGR